MDYRIFPPDELIDAVVDLPLSKSVSARQLVINFLTPGASPLEASVLSDSDDTHRLADALTCLSDGCKQPTINVGDAGTAMRFVTAIAAVTPGVEALITGSERMLQRPIGGLVNALRSLGAEIEYVGDEGFPPVKVSGRHLDGGRVTIDPTVSSQFISALMMVAPTMPGGLVIDMGDSHPVSMPYILMTARLMERAGVDVEVTPLEVRVAPGGYIIVEPYSERDWSAASYWYALSAISAGFITMPGLDVKSVQGDVMVADWFRRLGVDTAPSDEVDDALQLTPNPDQHARFEQDMSDHPDLAQTIAVTAAMLGIPFHLWGLSTLRHKETDRLEALRVELDKFGIMTRLNGEGEIVWDGARHPLIEMPAVDTYGDHRMAMAFAPAAVYLPGLIIRDVEVVTKSYPGYWDNLRACGFELTDASLPLPDEDNDDMQEETI